MKLKLFLSCLLAIVVGGFVSVNLSYAITSPAPIPAIVDPSSQAPVPAGCPSTTIEVCKAIPAGCPGSATYNKDPLPTNCLYYSSGSTLNTGSGGGLYSKYLNPFIVFLSGAVGVIVVISIIVGAIQYSSAGGDAQKVASARNRIKNAILALIAFIFLRAILNWIIPNGIG